VESCKRSLTHDPVLRSNVDWLTEVIRRFSDAALAARPLTSVNMKSLMRMEKVRRSLISRINRTLNSSDKWKKQETAYTDKEWTRDEIAAFEDAILTYGAELRAVRDEIATRSMPEVVRFYGHWKK
jgi:hypothetical protein